MIEQLREIAAQARQDSNGEEPIDIPGEEEVEELATEINVYFMLSFVLTDNVCDREN